MKDMQNDPLEEVPDLLADWISREQLARALDLTTDTLSRWEARRQGPPCTRIGRKIFYRRAAIQEWIRAQEQAHPQQIEAARRGYDDWWQALGWVREGLIAGGMLREVEVTGAMPKARPWEGSR